MKDIFKLTFQDKRFKLKMMLFCLLLFVIELVASILPLTLLAVRNDFINLIGSLLFLGVVLAISVFAYMVIINKLLVTYYPNLKVGAKDLIFKGLAVLTIMIPVVIVSYIVLVGMAFISYFINSMIISTILFVFGVVYVFQLVAMSLSLWYIVLDLIEDRVLGYKCVFRGLGSKIKKTRKYSAQILIRSIVYFIVAAIILGIVAFGLLVISGILAVALNSAMFYLVSVVILYIIYIIAFTWIYFNCYHFAIIRYKNIKKLLNN